MPIVAVAASFTGLAPYLAAVDELFGRELASTLPHVQHLIGHVNRFRGKMLRPTLVLLCGMAVASPEIDTNATASRKLGHEHVVLATVVEMVHVATLVHDDVLDGAEIRRRGATINHLRGNEAAVLLGDLLISHAFHLCSSLNSQSASRLIGHTTNIVCEGELTQNFYRRNWKLDEATYFDIIYRKTASLIETSCRLGALARGASAQLIEALALYGKHLGMAFQIVDDVLDIVGHQKTVGKSLGTDIDKGKLTLPMIQFLNHAALEHRELLVSLLESAQADRAEHVRQLLIPSPSIAYARQQAQSLVDQAIAAIQVLPAGEIRDILTAMARYTTGRDQ
ncbi:MAG: polyprenyl synthetase family protein [Phycisphaerae bacterium]|nr:polyprenyl synthetase family protein [Phycisphaerae bacterium]